MAVLPQMRALLLALVSATSLPGQADALQIILRAVAADESNWRLARHYTFSERVDVRFLDSQGALKSQEIRLRDVMLLDGSPYRRLVELDDRPLTLADEKKEQGKLARSTDARRRESATQRAARLAEYASRPEWQREAWRELAVAFDFRLTSEEIWEGRRVYVIHANPRYDYRPRSLTGRVLARLRAILWVDGQDYHVARAEAEVIDNIAAGLFLVRVAKGSRATVEQTRVNDAVWMPRQVRTVASARLGLVKLLRVEQEITYGNFRDFRTEMPVVSRVKSR
jgi:hypothetical protein